MNMVVLQPVHTKGYTTNNKQDNKDNTKLSHNTTRLDTTLLIGRTDRLALIPIVTPRSPNNVILINKIRVITQRSVTLLFKIS